MPNSVASEMYIYRWRNFGTGRKLTLPFHMQLVEEKFKLLPAGYRLNQCQFLKIPSDGPVSSEERTTCFKE